MRGSLKGEDERPKSMGMRAGGGGTRCCLTEMGLKKQEQVWWEKMEKMAEFGAR